LGKRKRSKENLVISFQKVHPIKNINTENVSFLLLPTVSLKDQQINSTISRRT